MPDATSMATTLDSGTTIGGVPAAKRKAVTSAFWSRDEGEVIAAVDGALGSTPAEPDDALDLDRILAELEQRVAGQFESAG